jgi:hypothetical protein
MHKFYLNLYIYAIFVRRKGMYLRTYDSFKSENRQKIGFANPQRKVRKSNKLFKSPNLRICDLRNLFADRPTLKFRQICQNHLNTTKCKDEKLTGWSEYFGEAASPSLPVVSPPTFTLLGLRINGQSHAIILVKFLLFCVLYSSLQNALI